MMCYLMKIMRITQCSVALMTSSSILIARILLGWVEFAPSYLMYNLKIQSVLRAGELPIKFQRAESVLGNEVCLVESAFLF